MVMVNTHGVARRVAPPGGKAPRLGTNPMAIGVPSGDAPLILDFGTSATAEGKVRVKKIAGQTCPPGWLLDSEGRATTDPNTLYGDPPGTILPMGGDQAYKGFGLGLMVEVFAGALSGGVCTREKAINQNGNCVFMQVISPDHLGGAEHFRREVACVLEFRPRVPACGSLPGDSVARRPGATYACRAEQTRHSVRRRQLGAVAKAGRPIRRSTAGNVMWHVGTPSGMVSRPRWGTVSRPCHR